MTLIRFGCKYKKYINDLRTKTQSCWGDILSSMTGPWGPKCVNETAENAKSCCISRKFADKLYLLQLILLRIQISPPVSLFLLLGWFVSFLLEVTYTITGMGWELVKNKLANLVDTLVWNSANLPTHISKNDLKCLRSNATLFDFWKVVAFRQI